MATSSIQGQLLEVSVIRCTKLKNTEWISKQDPYVSLGYGSTKYRTRTDTDGGTNPVFQEKFFFTLIEGLRELKVEVWNSNTMKQDDFIGSGMIHLQKVLSRGFDETAWPLHTKTGRHAGEVGLVMRYSQDNNSSTSCNPPAPTYAYGASHLPNGPPYSAPPPSTTSYAHSPVSSYQAASPYPATPYPAAVYPPPPAAYPYNQTQQAAYAPPYASPPTTYPSPSYPHTNPYRGAYPPFY